MTLTLYRNDMSTCAQKVRLVLAEKGLDWESAYIDLRAGDQRRADYLALNPAGVVPTLVHDGAVVTESTVVIEYLDDAFPDPALRPADAAARAHIRLWMKRSEDKMHAMVGALSFALAFRHEFLAMPDKGQSFIDAQKDPMRRMARRARRAGRGLRRRRPGSHHLPRGLRRDGNSAHGRLPRGRLRPRGRRWDPLPSPA